jgi:histidyl-tRNA synthetase
VRACVPRSLSHATMPANPSALLILHPRLNLYLKPFFLSPSLAFTRTRKFPIPRPPFSRNLSSLSSTAAAQSTGENGSGGGRSGALSSPLITEEVQKIDVNPPKGTRDFPPEEMRLRTWLFRNFREVIYMYTDMCLCMYVCNAMCCLYLIGCGI